MDKETQDRLIGLIFGILPALFLLFRYRWKIWAGIKQGEILANTAIRKDEMLAKQADIDWLRDRITILESRLLSIESERNSLIMQLAEVRAEVVMLRTWAAAPAREYRPNPQHSDEQHPQKG